MPPDEASGIETIQTGDIGDAVEDVQSRLASLGFLDALDVDGTFGEKTSRAVNEFCGKHDLPQTGKVTAEVWEELVDATYALGDRTLYLRLPNFRGRDVAQLQQALGALGFACGEDDGVFGAHTEAALREFQMNFGLPTDGIAGAYTYNDINYLRHSWFGKDSHTPTAPMGFARAAEVLGRNAVVLFGMDAFTRSVASRMSNLALATNPASKIVSADALSVEPTPDMLLIEIALDTRKKSRKQNADADWQESIPQVTYVEDDSLVLRLRGARERIRERQTRRLRVVLPGKSWMQAGEERTAQHYAITLLDALCQIL